MTAEIETIRRALFNAKGIHREFVPDPSGDDCESRYDEALAALAKVEEELFQAQAQASLSEDALIEVGELLGEAGILITESPVDGIPQLIDQRDEARARLARAEAALPQEPHELHECNTRRALRASEAKLALMERVVEAAREVRKDWQSTDLPVMHKSMDRLLAALAACEE